MTDYQDRYFEALDKLSETREERDTLFRALRETQKQLELARAMVSAYKHEHEGDEDDD